MSLSQQELQKEIVYFRIEFHFMHDTRIDNNNSSLISNRFLYVSSIPKGVELRSQGYEADASNRPDYQPIQVFPSASLKAGPSSLSSIRCSFHPLGICSLPSSSPPFSLLLQMLHTLLRSVYADILQILHRLILRLKNDCPYGVEPIVSNYPNLGAPYTGDFLRSFLTVTFLLS
jgi:hypothetical protein